jgi:hypothetical protein
MLGINVNKFKRKFKFLGELENKAYRKASRDYNLIYIKYSSIILEVICQWEI